MPPNLVGEAICMDGSIYTRQKCALCGKYLLHNPKRRGCFCPDHPDQAATKFIVRFPGDIYQRHNSYESACQSLNYLRYEKGTASQRKRKFNPDDYKSLRPNSFASLAPKYLERKKSLKSYGKICYYINTARDYFGTTNLKDISGGMIDDYLFQLKQKNGMPISDKTRSNHCSQLHDFWKWCLRREDIITLAEFPQFPEIEYELSYRKITTWEIQEKVIGKVKEMTYRDNPKIWLGIDMLATYTALRPDDLRRVTEGSLDENGWLTVYNPTKRKNKFKYIRLHEDHIVMWEELQRQFPALPETPFFRHHGRVRGTTQTGIIFGEHYLRRWWLRACDEIGLKGVPLYPGTKHTTATETAKLMGADRALKASGLTNKAFERYCQVENSDAFEVVTEILKTKKAKVINLNVKRRETE
jgi:hypothetical protein